MEPDRAYSSISNICSVNKLYVSKSGRGNDGSIYYTLCPIANRDVLSYSKAPKNV